MPDEHIPPQPPAEETPDPYAARRKTLMEMRKSELTALILELESRTPAASETAELEQARKTISQHVSAGASKDERIIALEAEIARLKADPLASQLEEARRVITQHVNAGASKDERILELEGEVTELNSANTAFDQVNNNLKGQIAVLKSGHLHKWLMPLIFSIIALAVAFIALLTKK